MAAAALDAVRIDAGIESCRHKQRRRSTGRRNHCGAVPEEVRLDTVMAASRRVRLDPGSPTRSSRRRRAAICPRALCTVERAVRMSALDARVNAYRPDLAAAYLRGRAEAARFVEGATYEIIEVIADLRRAPSHEAALDTQALYGERVSVYEINEEGWAWGQLASDGYVGYLPANALAKSGPAPTHTVIVPRTLCFPADDIQHSPLHALPMRSAPAIVRQDERFAVAANGWPVPPSHVSTLANPQPAFL